MPKLDLKLVTLLDDVTKRGGSDLHLIHGLPPITRICGKIGSLPYPALNSEGIQELVDPFLNEANRELFKRESRINCARSIGEGRYRFSIYMALGTVGASIRLFPQEIYPLAALGLPPIVGTLANERSGIILITGATSTGKSTTMASMLEWINQTGQPSKIIAIEDPIERIFKPCRSVFVQREVGVDTPSFAIGILDALRQDPDVICIGELRDVESINAAFVAAETGHLVLSTLHTPDASKTAQRIVTAVPAGEQGSMREHLATALEAVISQQLLPRADGKGLVLSCEILIVTTAVRQMIRENRLQAINDAIQSGMQEGMTSQDASIKNLYANKLITHEVALEHMRQPKTLGR